MINVYNTDGSVSIHKQSLQEVVDEMASKSIIEDKHQIELDLAKEQNNDIGHSIKGYEYKSNMKY